MRCELSYDRLAPLLMIHGCGRGDGAGGSSMLPVCAPECGAMVVWMGRIVVHAVGDSRCHLIAVPLLCCHQPRVNAAASDDATFGWGGPGGYVYQKAYVECFASPDHLKALMDVRDSGVRRSGI